MKIIIYFILFSLIFLNLSLSYAGIYRYEDERGVIHFTNCPGNPKFKLYIREGNEDDQKEDIPLKTTRINTYKDPNHYDNLIREYSERYGIDFALIKAMIKAESGFNPLAISRKGAKGLMQLMPETALRMNVSNVFSPRENIEAGVRYFKYLLTIFNGDLRLSLAAYNAGENIVSELRTIPPYQETVDYVRKVLNYYHIYK